MVVFIYFFGGENIRFCESIEFCLVVYEYFFVGYIVSISDKIVEIVFNVLCYII